MKVPITPNPFQSRYNAPPPIVISLGSFSQQQVGKTNPRYWTHVDDKIH
jgi:hypothetical protein